MNSIMSLVESFSTASALQVAAVLISKADPSLKLKLTKAQEKQLKVLACMFGAISRGLGGKIKKAVKNKLFDNQQPLPEGYYLPSNPCFTEAIIADVMAQSIDEITDTMDSSNKNILEQASGLLGGLSNLSASALLPTGLLSGAISGGLGSIGGGLNLGGAMSFITGLTTFFACIKEASCPESDTISNDGGEGDSDKEANLENAISKVEQEKKNQEIQAYADDNGISFDRAKNFLEGGVEETVFDGTKSTPITPPTNAEVSEYAENNLKSFTQARKDLIRDREIAAANADITAYAEDNNISFDRAKNFLEGNAEETVFNSNLDYGNLTEVDHSKFVDDSNNYFKKESEKTAFEKPTERLTVKKGPFTTTLIETPTSAEITTSGGITNKSSKSDQISFIKKRIEAEEKQFRNLRGDIRRDTLNDLNSLRRDLNLLDGGNRQNYDWINLSEEQLKDKNLNLNDVPFEVIDPNKKIDPRYENF